MAKKEINEGIRINKFISESGFCSRRDADQLITDGRVTINGEIATLGSRVAEGDKVKIDGETLQFVPMEMREYKLRRYGSSRRVAQGEEKKEEKAVKRQSSHREHHPEERSQVKKPQGESGRGDSRRERGEERKRSMSTSRKPEQPRLKSKTGGSAGAKSSTRPMQSNRKKSETSVKSFAREKRKK